MKANDRARLTTALRDHVAKMAADVRARMRAPGAARVAAERLHKDERVAEDFEVWTDLLSRRAAVLWVLKSVYVRVLEDRGLLTPGRLIDPEAQQLFEKLAPNLGETAFLRWIYKDLASAKGGLPELFSPQPAEVALPSDELSRALIAFWRHRDADTGAVWSFAEERFEGELMGDFYQELDPIVKDRFALCQTPDFVRAFILDRTLTPAIETFGADEVRLLDPACGSGHFLIDGLKRLVAATAEKHTDWDRAEVVAHALDRVVGIDLNDYACALGRTRLIMTAAELAGVTKLADAACFHPHVYWADGLEQVEREEVNPMLQTDLFTTVEEKPRATLTRSDVRAALKKIFEKPFHAVVANPPYIMERDEARKQYHRELIGKNRRYISATGRYSLGSPFTERCFQLAEKAGYVGLITSNNFMKREFGRPLIEKVLPGLDLTLVVDTSQAYIPFHGTPTVLLFGRNQRPEASTVRAVMGKRGESGTPNEPAKGKVWLGIVEGYGQVDFSTEYVSVADLPRETLNKHPWSLGGGGAVEIKKLIEDRSESRLVDVVERVGMMTILKQDEVFLCTPRDIVREAVVRLIDVVEGTRVRDFAIETEENCLFPYDPNEPETALRLPESSAVYAHFWRYRPLLRARTSTGFKTIAERGMLFYEYAFYFPETFARPCITFAFVATHNHFVFARGGKVFKQSAPVIKLSDGSREEEHLALLGLLNSSTACFWMKQVFHCKGSQGVNEGMKSQLWEQFFEFDATKVKLFPVAASRKRTAPYAAKLDAFASSRSARSIRAVLDDGTWNDGAALRRYLDERRAADFADLTQMIALQEELDWLCYALYGLDAASDVVAPDNVEPCPPTWLPWNLSFSEKDAANRAAVARREEPDEQPSDWWTRHGWEPLRELPKEASTALKKRVEARRALTAAAPAIALIETANFKRRWQRPDYAEQERVALTEWLADRVEATAKTRSQAFSLEQLVAHLQDAARVLAVCEVLTGRKDFSLSQLVAAGLQDDAVPSHRFHIYKPAGLVKREVWERTWADQRREDAGQKVTPEVPPAYGAGDFLKPDYWRLRGKLDVPKERFIAFTEVPGRSGVETHYGWAGWTAQQRVKAILAIDEELEDASVPLADRIALLDSAWRLLPDVAREEAAAANRLKAELQALVGPEGPSGQLIEDWKKRFPPPTSRTARPKKAAKRVPNKAAISPLNSIERTDEDDGVSLETGDV
jgi:hypothetical protein